MKKSTEARNKFNADFKALRTGDQAKKFDYAGYPARFLFVAAMNPCPCVDAGDPLRQCLCARLRCRSSSRGSRGRYSIGWKFSWACRRWLQRSDVSGRRRVERHDPGAGGGARGPGSASASSGAEVSLRTRTWGRANWHVPLDAATEVVMKSAIECLGPSVHTCHLVLKLARTRPTWWGATRSRRRRLRRRSSTGGGNEERSE
jgi:magnesium chelatase family protein